MSSLAGTAAPRGLSPLTLPAHLVALVRSPFSAPRDPIRTALGPRLPVYGLMFHHRLTPASLTLLPVPYGRFLERRGSS